MEKSNLYFPLLNAKNISTITDEKWDEAIGYYQNQEYDKIVPTIIEYINSDFTKYKTDFGYSIPHGSVILDIILTETDFQVICPFVSITDTKKIPLMRKLAELRLNPLDLANITLKDDNATFEYSCPLELCEPHKIYDLLKEICVFADRYDDEFIEKFGAKNIQEPKISEIDDHIKNEIYENIQKLIDDNIARLDYYISKRDGRKIWCTLNITFKQIEFYAHPQGYLRTEIERYIDLIYDRNLNFHDMIHKSKENLLKIKNYDKKKFLNNLYTIETFVPYKYSGKKESIRDNWEESFDDVKEMINNNNNEAACIEMLSMFYNLFYYNLVSDEISKPIIESLEAASNKPWNEASSILLNGVKSIMEESPFETNFGMDISQMMKEQMESSMDMIKNMMKGFSN